MMPKHSIVDFSLNHRRPVAMALAAFVLTCAAFIPWTGVNTDAETMLAERDAARIFNEQTKSDFSLHRDTDAANTFEYGLLLPMAVAVPLTLLTIFILNTAFFRRPAMVLLPLVVATAATVSAAGMLTALRLPVHLVSMTIPIFLMPISAVSSAHILSEFFRRYTKEKGPRLTAIEAVDALLTPTLYTSLILAASFASLAMTPIPSVQAFGAVTAGGIMIAWVFTIALVPMYVVLLGETTLENAAATFIRSRRETWLTRVLRSARQRLPATAAKPILTAIAIAAVVVAFGVVRIDADDAWIYGTDAERGRTAYLVLEDDSEPNVTVEFVKDLRERLLAKIEGIAATMPRAKDMLEPADRTLVELATKKITKAAFLARLSEYANGQRISTREEDADVWRELVDFFEFESQRLKLFQQPAVLAYVADLEDRLDATGLIDRSDSIADIVRENSEEPTGGRVENGPVPDSITAVAESLLRFQDRHTSEDLAGFVTSDLDKTSIRLQLKTGGSRDMKRVVAAVDQFFTIAPPPMPIRRNWAGRAYINLVWRHELSRGILYSLLVGSSIVFVMTAIPLIAERRGFPATAPQSDERDLARSFVTPLAIVVVVLLTMHQFSRTNLDGFMRIGSIAAPAVALLSASLWRKRARRSVDVRQAQGPSEPLGSTQP